jgi:tRNA pseudouridine55 synthase
VEREPRPVEVFRLELTAWEPPECVLEVVCSPGTYVRALAHDLGQSLGCGAHLVGLIRLASGGFRLEDAVSLETLAQAAAEGRWADLLHPTDAALTHLPALRLGTDAARRLCSGQTIALPPEERGEGGLARAYGPGETFLALVDCDPAAGVCRPRKVFRDWRPGGGTDVVRGTEP